MSSSVRRFIQFMPSLLIMGILFGLSGVLISWSLNEVGVTTREWRAAVAQKEVVERRLRLAQTKELDTKERAKIYQKMHDKGIIGQEKRLDWIELLRGLQQDLMIPSMSYEIGVQTSLENINLSLNNYYVSPMHLSLHLLHEEDLLRFLNRLQQEAKAIVIIDKCQMQALQQGAVDPKSLAKLSAECDLQWITVQLPVSES